MSKHNKVPKDPDPKVCQGSRIKATVPLASTQEKSSARASLPFLTQRETATPWMIQYTASTFSQVTCKDLSNLGHPRLTLPQGESRICKTMADTNVNRWTTNTSI